MMTAATPENDAGAPRELTGAEISAIRKLIVSECANYCRVYGCLPLESECVMRYKGYTGGGCKYFRSAVLPLDPALEAALTGNCYETRACAYCGKLFPARGRRAYCSDECKARAQRMQQREHMRKKRGNNV